MCIPRLCCAVITSVEKYIIIIYQLDLEYENRSASIVKDQTNNECEEICSDGRTDVGR